MLNIFIYIFKKNSSQINYQEHHTGHIYSLYQIKVNKIFDLKIKYFGTSKSGFFVKKKINM